MNKLIVSLPWSYSGSDSTETKLNSHQLKSNCEFTFVVCNENRVVVDSGQAPIELLPKTDSTILVAPTQALSWHHITVPKVPQSQMRAVLDGLLEEQLLEDTNLTAIALSPTAKSEKEGVKTWIATCSKEWLSVSISKFEMAGHRVVQVAPAFAPEPSRSESYVFITGTTEESFLTSVSDKGVLTFPISSYSQTHAPNLSTGFKHYIADDAVVFSEPAVAALAEKILNRPIQIRQQSAGLIESAQTDWELAQFDLKLSGDGDGIKRIRRIWQEFRLSTAWKPARWGFIGLILANVIGLNAWAWQQKSNLATKKALLTTQLTQIFPQVKVVVDPTLQMNKELASLRQSSGSVSAQNFESVLSAFSLLTNSKTPPTMIEYAANKTIFTGINLTDAEYALAQTKMKMHGYTLIRDGNRITVTTQADV
ncbi:MAG TPA: type II secretion system protein GspL [Burkholderiaceae bacterium]|nr:type II secretion system protein GspL [Burkholderiaceae bacterium]